MARIVKPREERRSEFLDVAQRMFQQRGFEQVSVGEIIETVGVAKGTFYHYFASKIDLLDAIISRSLGQVEQIMEPIVADPAQDALSKFNRLFRDLGHWKTANKEFFLHALRMLYRDENVLLRTKTQQANLAVVTPLLARVIGQGVEEGVFTVEYPAAVAEIVLGMGTALGESIAYQMLASDDWPALLELVMVQVRTYERSIERVLKAPEGSLVLMDKAIMAQWFTA